MKTLNRLADAIALDRDDNPVMLIEVKGRREESAYDRPQLVAYLREAGDGLPFAMLVTLEDIRIFKWDDSTLSEVLHLLTVDVLSPYDPEFRHKRIYEDYLTVLIEGWLRDVAFHWKSEKPPFFEDLERIGLAERLNGGMTENVRLRDL